MKAPIAGCMSACLLGLLAGSAFGDSESYPLTNPAYRSECGSCHVAYPPQLLDGRSWQAIMAQLDKHYGTDASLEAKTADEIRAYLAGSASRKGAPPASKSLLRITEARWFVRQHAEVPASVWKSEAVKSPANCSACHTKADQGNYGERALRVPR